MGVRLKKGDNVIVNAGSNKGKTGKIHTISWKNMQVTIQGVNMKKRHTKPDGKNPGGIVSKEAPIPMSNVNLVDKSGKATRVGYKVTQKDGKRVTERIARTTGETL